MMAKKIPYSDVMSRMKNDIDYIAEEAYTNGYEQATLIWRGKTNEESYQRGLSEGHDIGYKKGLEDGKAVNDKGCEGCKLQGTDSNICDQCCNSYANQWKSKDDEIEVGDEVEWTGDKYIVTYINYNIDTSEITDYDLLGEDGSVADHVKKCAFVKTGRHFDIKSILEDMRHD